MITFYHLNPFVFHMKSSFHLAKLLAPSCGSKVYNEIPLILSAKASVDINGTVLWVTNYSLISALIHNFTCEIAKLPWQRSVRINVMRRWQSFKML